MAKAGWQWIFSLNFESKQRNRWHKTCIDISQSKNHRIQVTWLITVCSSYFLFLFYFTTLVPEAFFHSLLANFATRTAFDIFFIGRKRWEPRKESLWSRPLGTSLSCHQLLTVVSDWRTFLVALWVIWLDGLNIFWDGSGVYMFTFMGMCGELLLYQRILLPGKAKVFVVELASPIVVVDGFYLQEYFRRYFVISSYKPFRWHRATVWSTKWGFDWNSESRGRLRYLPDVDWPWKIDHIPVPSRS